MLPLHQCRGLINLQRKGSGSLFLALPLSQPAALLLASFFVAGLSPRWCGQRGQAASSSSAAVVKRCSDQLSSQS
jgi:hypothetical protein